MEFGENLFCMSNISREENSNNNSTSFAWDLWEPTISTNSRLINTFYTSTVTPAESSAAAATRQEASLVNALMFLPQASTTTHDDSLHDHQQQQPPLYAGDGSIVHPDPHLMCLKLGKRHYFEDANAPQAERHLGYGGCGGGSEFFLTGKRGKGYYGSISTGGRGSSSAKTASYSAATVPRCQVEGCHVGLMNAKDYHRRHKVCEMHSKAPKVVVLGLEQRFCQQCSRFHVVSEFDDSKRSCRRRLAGHNERRRKSSQDSVARDSYQENKLMVGGFPYWSSAGCAFSLLSSKSDSWLAPAADLSSRCSAALRELIAENRAAVMARQLLLDRDLYCSHHHAEEELKQIQPAPESHYFPQQHQMFP